MLWLKFVSSIFARSARNRARTARSIAHLRLASRINLVCKAADISINPGKYSVSHMGEPRDLLVPPSISSSLGFFFPPSIFRLHSSSLLPAIKRRTVVFVGDERVGKYFLNARYFPRKILICPAGARRISTARYGDVCLETEKKVTKEGRKKGRKKKRQKRKDEEKGEKRTTDAPMAEG